MLEILGLIYLSGKNKSNAVKRGRKPALFVALTFLLWIGMEAAGIAVALLAGWQSIVYILGLALGIGGGVISYLLAKNCRPGAFVSEAIRLEQAIEQSAEWLEEPAGIKLIRERSLIGIAAGWTFTLNGRPVDSPASGEYIKLQTDRRQNILRATDVSGNEAPHLAFDIESGGWAEIYFKGDRFVQGRSTGIKPVSPLPEILESEAAEG